jgi:hypothetical protein
MLLPYHNLKTDMEFQNLYKVILGNPNHYDKNMGKVAAENT